MNRAESVERLIEIREKIEELLVEARDIVTGTCGQDSVTTQRMEGYWAAQIATALDKNHQYLGGCMFTMQDTINELEEEDDAE